MQRYFSFLVVLTVLCGCSKIGRTDDDILVDSMFISGYTSTMTLEKGNTKTLKILLFPENAGDREILWEIGNADIVSVTVDELDPLSYVIRALNTGSTAVKVISHGNAKVYREFTVKVVAPGAPVIPDPEPDPDPDPDPEPDPTPDPTPGSMRYGSYFELPLVKDANNDGRDDANSDYYYAQHHFKMNSRQYRNYTVCFNAKTHCAMWVAAPRHAFYSGSANRTDAYGEDPVIAKLCSGIQYFSKSTGDGCNKGHLLGSKERTCCSEANRQVFYYSNIAPQLSSTFNTGGGGWNLLEDWVDTKVVADTLYEVVGCYFEKYTDGYGHTVSPKTISFGGRDDVAFPTMFYYALLTTKSGKSGKALDKCSASELKCAAFVRSHAAALKGQKPSSREMMSIADLEKITGFTYFSNVPNAPKSSFSASDWGL